MSTAKPSHCSACGAPMPAQSTGGPCPRCLLAGGLHLLDHQATLGAYVGKTAVRDGKGVMIDWRYADGAKYLPSDDEVRKLRPQ